MQGLMEAEEMKQIRFEVPGAPLGKTKICAQGKLYEDIYSEKDITA